MEKDMGKVFKELIADEKFGGRYVSITPKHPNFIKDEEYTVLVNEHIMFKDMSKDDFLLSAGIS